jgi:hypothetical protein
MSHGRSASLTPLEAMVSLNADWIDTKDCPTIRPTKLLNSSGLDQVLQHRRSNHFRHTIVVHHPHHHSCILLSAFVR